MKKCIVVLGMHRSGTSLMTGLLQVFGVYVGGNLLEPVSYNEKGFFEHRELYRIDDKVLKELGSSWKDYKEFSKNWYKTKKISKYKEEIKKVLKKDFGKLDLFAIKDPRICVLLPLPLYLEVFKELKIKPLFVIMKRKEIEVAKSLKKIYKLPVAHSLKLYEKYAKSIEEYTKEKKKAYIEFDELINDTKEVMDKISKTLNVPFRDYRDVKKEVSNFVEPKLKHYTLDYMGFIEELAEDVGKRGGEINNLNRALGRRKDQIFLLKEESGRRKDQIFLLKEELNSMKNSLTWRTVQKFDGVIRTFSPYLIAGYKHKKTKRFEQKKIKPKIEKFSYEPLVSLIVPVYNVDIKWLDLAIKSVVNQTYKNWELCIADDKSIRQKTINFLRKIRSDKIKIKFLDENQGIAGASNEALSLATGDYVGFLDNDDELSPDALYEVVKAINKTKADFIYSDEGKMDLKGNYSGEHFKPDYSPDMLLSRNYICHFSVIKKEIVDKVGGFRKGFDGSQDYDFFLRVLEKTNKIYHVPKVLYHWRKVPGSTAIKVSAKPFALESGKKALEEALKRRKINGKVIITDEKYGTYRIKRRIKGYPLISIIIPFKDKSKLLRKCVKSIIEKSSYKNFEIILISNNSKDKNTFEIVDEFLEKDSRIRFYEYNVPFNYSKINNYGVSLAKGKHVLLLNNDTEVINKDWIGAMLEHSQRSDVGAVGAKLYYPNDKIQHAGIIIGLGGVAGHSHKGIKRKGLGYFRRASIVQNMSAVTAACLMVKKELYLKLNGLNENELKIAFNDVDFCLRLRERGYLNIFTPFAELYHHESASRGYEVTSKEQKRFRREIVYIKKRHSKILNKGDPYYNPNLSLDKEDFSLK